MAGTTKAPEGEKAPEVEQLEQALVGHARLITMLAEVAAEIDGEGRVKKRGFNQHFNYQYATKDDIVDAVRGPLARRGVVFLPLMNEVEDIDRNQVVVKWHMQFLDRTGATIVIPWQSRAADSQDKALGKAITVGIRTFLVAAFNIATGDELEDPDHSQNHSPATEVKHDPPAAGKRQRSAKIGTASAKTITDTAEAMGLNEKQVQWVLDHHAPPITTSIADAPKEFTESILEGLKFVADKAAAKKAQQEQAPFPSPEDEKEPAPAAPVEDDVL